MNILRIIDLCRYYQMFEADKTIKSQTVNIFNYKTSRITVY